MALVAQFMHPGKVGDGLEACSAAIDHLPFCWRPVAARRARHSGWA